MNHDNQRWDDPDEFRPERFSHGKVGYINDYAPFGGGKRQCIAMNMALAEIRVVVSMMRK